MDPQLQTLLHAHQLRNTPARQAVFGALKSGPALTSRELRARTAGRLDTASLYRTLALFRGLGIIQDVVIGGRRKLELTDAFAPHHHHISCRQCGRAVAIHNDSFERSIKLLAAAEGFTHDAHSFEITGLCPGCRAAAPNIVTADTPAANMAATTTTGLMAGAPSDPAA